MSKILFYLFMFACAKNQLWLVKICHKFRLTDSQMVEGLLIASAMGNTNIIKWLISLGIIDVNNMELAFISACKHGKLELAKWLHDCENIYYKQDKKKINIRANKDSAFIGACENNHKHVAVWLSLLFKGYIFDIDHTKKIINWKINNE